MAIAVKGTNLDGGISQARLDRLEKFTKAGWTYQARKDYHRMALCLQIIYNEKLYLESDSKDIYDYVRTHFNIQRGSTSNYLQVARKFLNSDTGNSVFIDNNVDFDITQLIKLKKLSVEEVKEMLQSGVISFDSTVREIEEAVNKYDKDKENKKKQAIEESLKPLNEAYEKYHVAFNKLRDMLSGNNEALELMQEIMDCVVLLYNENDRLWK